MTILRFNTATRTMLDFQIITTTPDATVSIGPRMRYPRTTDGTLITETGPDGTTSLVTPAEPDATSSTPSTSETSSSSDGTSSPDGSDSENPGSDSSNPDPGSSN